jgi:DGQHR domain-containing protein
MIYNTALTANVAVRQLHRGLIMATLTMDTSNEIAGKDEVQLDGALAVQRGWPTFLTFAPALDVVRQAKVDIYDPKTEEGYQRSPTPARMRAAAHYYSEGGLMPNPLLVNIRENDFDQVRIKVGLGAKTEFDEAVRTNGDWIGMAGIQFPRKLELWIYDGQHRAGGLEELLAGREGQEFSDFPVPLSITIGLPPTKEMKQFYDVNTNAKSVKTDLAWELLRIMAEDNPDLASSLEESGKDWTNRGIDIVKALHELPGPWKDHIQSPNEKGTRSDNFTITQAQFVRSLKPVIDMPLFNKAEPEIVAQVINAYWKGLAKVLPEPFDPSTSSKDWVIQKGVGAIPLHQVLPRVIEVVRARGLRLGDPDAYADVTQGLVALYGQGTDELGNTVEISGVDFWRGGVKGVASAYTGDAGRRRLGLMIQALLPKPTSEITL